jgi:signal transduction histidine kinase
VTDRTVHRLAVAAAIVVGALVVASGIFLFWLNRRLLYGNDIVLWSIFSLTAIAYTLAGYAIVHRSQARVIGWLCFLAGGVLELSLLLSMYAIYAVAIAPGSLPAPGLMAAIAEPLPIIHLGTLALILALFPTGHPVGPRWQWCIGSTVAAMAVAVLSILNPHMVVDIWSNELSHAGVTVRDPLGIGGLHGLMQVVPRIGALLLVIGAVGAIISLFVRRRRAAVEERRQIRWLAFVGGAILGWIVLVLPLVAIFDPGANGALGSVFWLVITPLVALGPPIAIGIGIVRYRLYDIDLVIRKTVIVAVVGFALTILYVGVLAVATLAPVSRAVVAVLLVAITFNPVRRAGRTIGDRAAYGKRASSYEVLSDFSGRIAETYAIDDVLPRMATVLAEGTSATSAIVWLRVGSQLRPVATSGDVDATALPLVRGELPVLPGEACEIRQAGELLGALSVTMPANDPLDDARRALLQDMAAQAGLVLRNARLIEELRASRQRLVAAQDEERRKLERNIHDGAQQQLVALSVQLKLARKMLERDTARAGTMLDSLGDVTTQALEDLRDLARGIYPPLLADRGLPAALGAQAHKAALPVTVECDEIGRYEQNVEAAVYFCTLEALNNIAKYARASHATVALEQTNGSLSFTVTDDGAGFDIDITSYGTGLQGMVDRLEAVGGSLLVESVIGSGTTVIGTVPVEPGQAEAASQAASSRSGPNDDLGM